MLNQNFQPNQFSDLVFEEECIKQRLFAYASGKRDGHIILYGDYGTGKSTAAKIIAETRCDDETTGFVDIIHARDANIEIERSLLRLSNGFNIQQMIGVNTPYAVIDEADQLSEINQHHLRAFMDNAIGFVILTTNHIHALDKGIRDRADEIEIKSLSPSAIFERANNILKAQGIVVEQRYLLRLLSTTSGSWRDVARALDDLIYSKAS
jgi:replication-associated recombination protein RarA